MALDLSSLEKAVTALEEAIGVVENRQWFDQQPAAVRNTLLSGVVQSVEFVYELCMKMMQRQVRLEALSPSQTDYASFRDLLRSAAERGLIEDVEAWFVYRTMLFQAAEAHSQEGMRYLHSMAPVFLRDARTLLSALKGPHE